MKPQYANQHGVVNAADFGFSSESGGLANAKALQDAVDCGGTVAVTQPGTYNIAKTVYVGSNTSVIFGNGVSLRKVDEQGPFTHVLLNKGALTRTYDHNIVIAGLSIIVNGVDVCTHEVYGLRGQLALFYVKDARIERFRCLDLGKLQFAIHVCAFEDLIIDDVMIKGNKDGVHLGRGKRFTIRNGVFQTYDDAIALNAHDYATSNPEMGWIEQGVVEQCYDLNAEHTTGFFCRILAGAWRDWAPGMTVQQSDSVVCNGRVYRVQAQPDGTVYTSVTPPEHDSGRVVLDGICWGMAQTNVTYTAGVRNVVFRDIVLEKPRIAFSIHFDNDRYSRSYYPGAAIPMQENLLFDHIVVAYDAPRPLLAIATPVDVVAIANSRLNNNGIWFQSNDALPDYLTSRVNVTGCVFSHPGALELITNSVAGKHVVLQTSGSVELSDGFSARIAPGNGRITVNSDLTGLQQGEKP